MGRLPGEDWIDRLLRRLERWVERKQIERWERRQPPPDPGPVTVAFEEGFENMVLDRAKDLLRDQPELRVGQRSPRRP
jgi:hypothetical protein